MSMSIVWFPLVSFLILFCRLESESTSIIYLFFIRSSVCPFVKFQIDENKSSDEDLADLPPQWFLRSHAANSFTAQIWIELVGKLSV